MATAVHYMPQPCPSVTAWGCPLPVPTLQLPVVTSSSQKHAVPSSARTFPSPTTPIPITMPSGFRAVASPPRGMSLVVQPRPSQTTVTASSCAIDGTRNLLAAGNLVSERPTTEEKLLASGNLIRDEAAEAAVLKQLATVQGPMTLPVKARADRATLTPRRSSTPLMNLSHSAPSVAQCSGQRSSRAQRRSFCSAKLPLASRQAFNTRTAPAQPSAMPQSAVMLEPPATAGLASTIEVADQHIVGGPEEVALPDDVTTYRDSERGVMQEVAGPSPVSSPSPACEVLLSDAGQIDKPLSKDAAPKTGVAARLARAGFSVPGI